MARKRPIYVIFITVLAALFLLSARYLLTIQIDAVRLSAQELTILPDGSFIMTFSPSKLLPALLPLLPSLLLVIGGIAVSLTACIRGWMELLSPRGAWILCAVSGGCALLAAVWFRILTALSAAGQIPLTELAEFMQWRYYSPFGIFGAEGINVTFLTEGTLFESVKYIILTILSVFSFLIAAALLRRELAERRQ